MRKYFLSRTLAVALCLATLLCALCLTTGCASPAQPMLTLEGQSITVNHYNLMLSRVKGNLTAAGYNVNAAYWGSVTDLATGATRNDIARNDTLANAKQILAALVLFEQEGLTLPQSYYDEIDRNIQDMINADANGSKSEFNGVLSAYGVNVDILREIYVKEAKYEYVKNHLYGEDKLTDTVRTQFLSENAVAFKQIMVRAYEYLYVTDEQGDIIYYLPTENNAKVNNIAYDQVNGYVRIPADKDEPVTDKNGDVIYYVAPDSDHIAYDKSKGKPTPKTDANGTQTTRQFTPAEKDTLKNTVVTPLEERLEGASMATFETEMLQYYKSIWDADSTASDMAFLYTMKGYYQGSNGGDLLTDLSDVLKEMEVGEIRTVETTSGFHIVMKYNMPEDAVTNDSYNQWFDGLDELITNRLFADRCAPLAQTVTVDEALWKETPDMADVPTNFYY